MFDDLMEILAGCDGLTNPDGYGFQAGLKALKTLGLAERQTFAAGNVKYSGWALTPRGREVANAVQP